MTNFGIDQIGKPTPLWAKNMFRVVFVLTTVASFWVGASTLIEPLYKAELMLGLKSLDMIIFGFSKLFGVELPKKDIPE